MKQQIQAYDGFRIAGPLISVNGRITARISAAIGELCRIIAPDGLPILSEVIGFEGQYAQIMPLRSVHGIRQGATVVALNRQFRVPVGEELLGRVIDTLGNPIDGKAPLRVEHWLPILTTAPEAMSRKPITVPFETGIRAIDGLLTLGRGQRIGLFAGGGVGKSTLLGEIARQAESDVNVVAMVGERGREVEPFVSRCLGEKGLAKSIVIVSTSDNLPLLRIRAAQNAITIADYFRQQGKNVFLMIDSITRLAIAQRELSTLLGEPPSARGYPPSTFQMLATLMEQMGPGEQGSITGLMTVLVDGDDLNEPVADAIRAMLDGHIMLDRNLAERNHYPAISISNSISRLFTDITDPKQQQAAGHIRASMAAYQEIADLLRIGAYQMGTSPQADRAIRQQEAISTFLQQAGGQRNSLAETRRQLIAIASSEQVSA
jgi:flagellum-specific ATP synthase